MSAPARTPFVLLPGGKPPDASPGVPLARGTLRLVPGGVQDEVGRALVEAVEAARQMRLEIERRIARALEAFEDRG